MCRGYSTLLYLLTGPVSAAMHTVCLGRRCVANSFNHVPAGNWTLDSSTTLTSTDRCSANLPLVAAYDMLVAALGLFFPPGLNLRRWQPHGNSGF